MSFLIDTNIISEDLKGNAENTIKTQKWKFENYQIENWERWREIPFHLQEGEDTSKYFRYERTISRVLFHNCTTGDIKHKPNTQTGKVN